MELIRGQQNIRPHHHGCVLTIGNFDGVHLGHQTIIRQLARIANDSGLPAVLMMFEPQPQEFFFGQNAPARLMRFREKIDILNNTSLDYILCLRFNRALASLPPETFIDHLLIAQLGIKYIVVGDDFRFGRNGAGDISLLRSAGKDRNFQAVNCDTYQFNGRRISSSWIRETLARGDLSLAEKLLDRPYSMQGHVLHGDRLGRTIGFPTANVALHRHTSPLTGVYAVTVQGIGKRVLPGVANVGNRPTVGGLQTRLEVHLFNFSEDIYGRYLKVSFVQKIRNEQRFDTFASLQTQIRCDAEQAREILDLSSTSN
jgi:riboflavin kinase/FMN adenylyltransferase